MGVEGGGSENVTYYLNGPLKQGASVLYLDFEFQKRNINYYKKLEMLKSNQRNFYILVIKYEI